MILIFLYPKPIATITACSISWIDIVCSCYKTIKSTSVRRTVCTHNGFEYSQISLFDIFIHHIVGRNSNSVLWSYRICGIGNTAYLKDVVPQCRSSYIIACICVMWRCRLIILRHCFQMAYSSNQHHHSIAGYSYCCMGGNS